jgi:hypothetical protein
MTTNKPEPTTDELIGDLLMRPYEVRLMAEFDAEGPTEAIDGFVNMVAHRGFDDFIYRVRDTQTNEIWFVRDGEVTSLEDFLAAMDEDDDDIDDDEDDEDEDEISVAGSGL